MRLQYSIRRFNNSLLKNPQYNINILIVYFLCYAVLKLREKKVFH